jgi:hypothetical protein
MTREEIEKYGEIQYLKGRLDELYKSYQPGNPSHTNRVVDARISKYETKLKELDEVAYHLYQVERTNVRFSKQKSKKIIKNLLEETLSEIQNDTLKEKIENQLNTYN